MCLYAPNLFNYPLLLHKWRQWNQILICLYNRYRAHCGTRRVLLYLFFHIGRTHEELQIFRDNLSKILEADYAGILIIKSVAIFDNIGFAQSADSRYHQISWMGHPTGCKFIVQRLGDK